MVSSTWVCQRLLSQWDVLIEKYCITVAFISIGANGRSEYASDCKDRDILTLCSKYSLWQFRDIYTVVKQISWGF